MHYAALFKGELVLIIAKLRDVKHGINQNSSSRGNMVEHISSWSDLEGRRLERNVSG